MKNCGQCSTQGYRVGVEAAVSLLVDHTEQVNDQRPEVMAVAEASATG
jgi:hypothetical protein